MKKVNKNNVVLGISGKIASGKDTVGSIIQYFTSKYYNEGKTYYEYLDKVKMGYGTQSECEIKKFADKLKDIVCMLIGCSREDLEDQNFKDTELPKIWWKYDVSYMDDSCDYHTRFFSTEEEADDYIKLIENDLIYGLRKELVKLTPRLMLQILGTECGRNIIHPNIWVNSTMADFKENSKWIITDTRFVNEGTAIHNFNGINIRVNRNIMPSSEWSKRYPHIIVYDPDGWDRQNYQHSWYEEKINFEEFQKRVSNSTCMIKNHKDNIFYEHESETSLDDYSFDFVIDNNGTLDDLIDEVSNILKKCEIIS